MRTVVIWDADGDPPTGDWTTILWRAFAPGNDAAFVSMPRIVEENAEALRARYLAWIYDLGQARMRGKRVVEHLALRPGFSYWWMNTLSHTPNYYESPHITDAIKCFAFEDWLGREVAPAAVRLHSANDDLRRVLETFCQARNLPFSTGATPEHRPLPVPSAPSRAASVRRIAAAAWRQLARAGSRRPAGRSSHASLCFFDTLVYLKSGALAEGRFRSDYWGALTTLLERAGQPATWVHIFYPHAAIRTLADADAALQRFAGGSGGREAHVLLDAHVTLRAVADTVASCGRLALAAWRMRGAERLFRPAGSSFSFWPFFSRNWYNALVGAPAVRHCLRLALFEATLASIPKQPLGIFLLENQPWEMALLHAWRTAGHGRIIGVPHTTARFWDLRYFYDPRTYERTGAFDLPMPDAVAVNGPMALRTYRDGGYPASRLTEVEALRFAHLAAASVDTVTPGSVARHVLICGDNIPGSNDKVMRIVEAAASLLPPATRFVFKPHKAAPFDPSGYPAVRVEVQDGDLAAMLAACDVAVTGTVTSASADAYCRGRRVAVLLDGAALDGCPLRGLEAVERFSSGEELAAIIQSSAPPAGPPATLFHLDPSLPRWRTLLGVPRRDDQLHSPT